MINKQFIDFLQRAKKATFASKTARPIKTKDNGLEYSYEERPFLYKDAAINPVAGPWLRISGSKI